MAFADNLKQLPSVAHLDTLELINAQGEVVATLHNKPGQAGSLAVYSAVAERFGAIDTEAAKAALDIFAEHTADARQHPGHHPNIDRLLSLIDSGETLNVKRLPA